MLFIFMLTLAPFWVHNPFIHSFSSQRLLPISSVLFESSSLSPMRLEARPHREARSVTMRDSGHQPVPNELACEVCSPVSRGKLLSRGKDKPGGIAVVR